MFVLLELLPLVISLWNMNIRHFEVVGYEVLVLFFFLPERLGG